MTRAAWAGTRRRCAASAPSSSCTWSRAGVAEVGAAAGQEPAEESWTPSTVFDPALRDRLAALLAGSDGTPAPVLPTAAGHDAGVLSAAGIPSGMLFVR